MALSLCCSSLKCPGGGAAPSTTVVQNWSSFPLWKHHQRNRVIFEWFLSYLTMLKNNLKTPGSGIRFGSIPQSERLFLFPTSCTIKEYQNRVNTMHQGACRSQELFPEPIQDFVPNLNLTSPTFPNLAMFYLPNLNKHLQPFPKPNHVLFLPEYNISCLFFFTSSLCWETFGIRSDAKRRLQHLGWTPRAHGKTFVCE